jgi:hypothetical protein
MNRNERTQNSQKDILHLKALRQSFSLRLSLNLLLNIFLDVEHSFVNVKSGDG